MGVYSPIIKVGVVVCLVMVAMTTVHGCASNSDDETIIDGYWNGWNGWGSCSKTCGVGSRSRSRSCVSPQFGGKSCNHFGPQNTVSQCTINPNCPIDGYPLSWSTWGSCSKECGVGKRQRMRYCATPLFGGKLCTGSPTSSSPCNIHRCPVLSHYDNGYLTPWGLWSSCSKTCGGGSRFRRRVCNTPKFGGNGCSNKPLRSTSKCSNNICPEDCKFGDNNGSCQKRLSQVGLQLFCKDTGMQKGCCETYIAVCREGANACYADEKTIQYYITGKYVIKTTTCTAFMKEYGDDFVCANRNFKGPCCKTWQHTCERGIDWPARVKQPTESIWWFLNI